MILKKNLIFMTLFLALVLAAILSASRSSAYFAYSSSPLPLPSISISNVLLNHNILNNDTFKNMLSHFGINNAVTNFKLLNTQNLSGNDLLSILKSITVLGINLFLIVIETVAGILKALLPFLS